MNTPEAILIAGPTASGKSAMAVELAKQHGGVVVNADSMQVYRELSVLSARPNESEMQGIEHRLFGHASAAHAYSVAQWLDDVGELLDELRGRGAIPVFVGGTGLYFKALLEGLADIPESDASIRQYWREFADEHGERLHQELARRDPVAAAGLAPGDTQRIIRALEVYDATGMSIVHWQNKGGATPFPDRASMVKIVLEIPPPLLSRRIDIRFDEMMRNGAVDEVKALASLSLPSQSPAMKAIGVPQLLAYLAGDCSLNEAVASAKTASRRYSKRQRTWFRHQLGSEWKRIQPPYIR